MNIKVTPSRNQQVLLSSNRLIRFASAIALLVTSLTFTGTTAHAQSSNCSARAQYVDLTGCDLTGADLSSLDLTGVDFSNADLTGANLSNATLTDAKFIGADMVRINANGADLSNSVLVGVDLSRSNLTGAKLSEAIFNGSTLYRTKLSSANLTNADFTNANLSGANLFNAVISGMEIRYTNLSGTNLSALDLHGSSFYSGTTLAGANLSGANLSGSIFSEGVSLRSAQLSGADLTGITAINVDFRNTSGLTAIFKNAKLGHSKFEHASLGQANFDNADLQYVDFSYGNLNGANFKSSVAADRYNFKIFETKFQHANLAFAKFDGTVICGADFSHSSMMYASFEGTGFYAGCVTPTYSPTPSSIFGPAPDLTIVPVDFSSAELSNSNFKNTSLIGFVDGEGEARFGGNVIFSNATMRGANFTNSMLDSTDFSTTNVTSANFTQAKLCGKFSSVNFQFGNFTSARFSGHFNATNFQNANMTGAKFSRQGCGDIQYIVWKLPLSTQSPQASAVPTPVQLDGANFSDANLTNTDFSPFVVPTGQIYYSDPSSTYHGYFDIGNGGVNYSIPFKDVNLTNATLNGANFSGVTWTNVTCVDGSKSSANSPEKCQTDPFQATAVVKPKITGTAKISTTTKANVLKLSLGTWVGLPTPVLTYQWYKCSIATALQAQSVSGKCSKLSGATTATLTVTSSLKNYYVLAQVTGTSAGNPATTWYTASTIQIK